MDVDKQIELRVNGNGVYRATIWPSDPSESLSITALRRSPRGRDREKVMRRARRIAEAYNRRHHWREA